MEKLMRNTRPNISVNANPRKIMRVYLVKDTLMIEKFIDYFKRWAK